MIRSQALGGGSYLPAKNLTNTDMASMMETSDEWIRTRTGITERHIAADGERTSDMGVAAAKAAMAAAQVGPEDIDLIICATTTPDETFPSTASIIQAKLGIHQGAAFDVQAVCTGFIYAMATADSFIRAGNARTVLVIGADAMSRILDWDDRTTAVLFGDGAGAVVLRAGEANGTTDDRGVLAAKLYADGSKHDMLYVDGGPSSTQTTGHIRMQGREVFRNAVTNIAGSMLAVTEAAGLEINDIDWFVPHQANQRILDGIGRKLSIPVEKIVSTVALHGNTSAASVPLALMHAVDDGRIQKGNLLLLEAMGGGFTWGSILLRW